MQRWEPVYEGLAEQENDRAPVFAVPGAWWPHVHPRRGGRVRRDPAIKADAPRKVRARLKASMPDLEEVLVDPASEGPLVDAARAHLAGDATPLGAAAVAALVEEHPSTRNVLRLLADAWVLEHGLPFAARAAVEAFGVQAYREAGTGRRRELWTPPPGRGGYWSSHGYHSYWPSRVVMERVRTFLAAAPDDEHEAAVAAVEPLRAGLRSLLATAYLVPTRRNWVDAAFDEAERTDVHEGRVLLMLSLDSVAQLQRSPRKKLRHRDVAHTVADALGPDLAATMVSFLEPDLEASFRERVLETVVEFPTGEAFDLLLARLGERQVVPTVLDMARRYPVVALERFAAAQDAERLLENHLRRYPELAHRVELPENARRFVEGVRAERARLDEAPVDALPAVLVAPPWTVPRTPVEPLVVEGLTAPDHRAVEWEPGQEAEWAAATFPGRHRNEDWSQEISRYRAGTLDSSAQDSLFFAGPVDALRPLVSEWRPEVNWYSGLMGKAVLARFGVDALPVALHLAPNRRDEMEDLLFPLVSLETARFVARWPLRLKSVRDVSAKWLKRHAAHAARFLVPDAVGPAGAARTAAEVALRQIPEQAREAAADYGPEAEKAIDRLLSIDPLLLLPETIPVPGAWADPGVLPRVSLRGTRQVLPLQATGHLLTVLALCSPEKAYAGVDVVRNTCDRASLARFSWELFEVWRANGMPSKDGWVFTALGLLGDDEAVRGLVPLIRAWPGEGQHARAVTGLDVLAAIGTDAALAGLNGIAQRVKFAGIRTRAQERIRDVAAGMGLTAEELGDRLVPDFDLDDASTLVVDYGSRRFTVGFDEQLRPFVLDGSGKRLRDLPKPGAKDDGGVASAEHMRFGRLKKDVRTVAGDQVARLERSMVLVRRWPAAQFRVLLAGHPLVRHLVRRLVWVSEDGCSFRVAEDGTFADVRDEVFVLADDAVVGVAHPLHLGDAVAAWGEVFADYEILQPFPQLGRPVHRLTEAELSSGVLKRFEDVEVEVGRLLGLTKGAWERGAPMDAGIEHEMTRPLPGGGTIEVALEPGIAVGAPHEWQAQVVRGVRLVGKGSFGELDSITASEVLAELTGLTN